MFGGTEFSEQQKDCDSLQKDRLQHGQQTACMVVNPVMVDNFVSPFHCMTVGRSSD